MSREFLTWLWLECNYEALKIQAARQGSIISRDAFANLSVFPVWRPGAVAQLYAIGADIVGFQVAQPIMPNRPAAAPNGRIPR